MTALQEAKITSENREEILGSSLTERQLSFVYRLSDHELRAIDGTEGIDEPIDYYLIARARLFIRDKLELAKKFQRRYKIREEFDHDYHLEELKWIEHEKELLKCKLGRDPSERELARDFLANGNGEAFRIYFYFKYKDKIERC